MNRSIWILPRISGFSIQIVSAQCIFCHVRRLWKTGQTGLLEHKYRETHLYSFWVLLVLYWVKLNIFILAWIRKAIKINKFKRWKIRYLINLFLQQFNFIVKFINIVEECKVFIFHFNEFSYQPIDVIYTCGFLYSLKSFLVRLKNRDKKSQITWCINKPVQSFPK